MINEHLPDTRPSCTIRAATKILITTGVLGFLALSALIVKITQVERKSAGRAQKCRSGSKSAGATAR